MIMVIGFQEVRRIMLSPLAWVILALVQFITALQFLDSVEDFMLNQPRLANMDNPPGVSDWVVAPLFANAAFILLMAVPVISMRSLSAERREKTFSLLMSSPVSMTEIVLGKYVGMMLFLAIMVGMVSLMPLTLWFGTALDIGKLVSGSLGLFLMLSAFAAAGLFISSLTKSPAVAAIASLFLLFGLWLMFWVNSGAEQVREIIGYISLLHHFMPLLQGSINSSDLVYFAIFAFTFLVLTIWRLDAQRLQA